MAAAVPHLQARSYAEIYLSTLQAVTQCKTIGVIPVFKYITQVHNRQVVLATGFVILVSVFARSLSVIGIIVVEFYQLVPAYRFCI